MTLPHAPNLSDLVHIYRKPRDKLGKLSPSPCRSSNNLTHLCSSWDQTHCILVCHLCTQACGVWGLETMNRISANHKSILCFCLYLVHLWFMSCINANAGGNSVSGKAFYLTCHCICLFVPLPTFVCPTTSSMMYLSESTRKSLSI